jgi:hypothetical protein
MPDTFSDLPDALVRDLLTCAIPLGEEVRKRIDGLRAARDQLRESAKSQGIIKRKADLDVPREPSVVGIDGSYQIHRLTSLDLCAAAAVAIEGTSKEAKRHWPEPYHRMWAGGLQHHDSTTGALRSLMVGQELDLAREAPHDLVLLDGAFASLVIYINQGLTVIDEVPPPLSDELRRRWNEQRMFERLIGLMRSERILAVPKFTSRNEFTTLAGFQAAEGVDGKTLATLILEPGEYTHPMRIYDEASGGELDRYHLPKAFCPESDDAPVREAMRATRVIYYRPFGWVPALRLELPGAMATSPTRLSIALEGITRQYFSPAVVEPYPLFIADRMVKSLGAGVAAIEQAVSQHVADGGADTELTILFLRNYRTEGGRGGV